MGKWCQQCVRNLVKKKGCNKSKPNTCTLVSGRGWRHKASIHFAGEACTNAAAVEGEAYLLVRRAGPT